MAKFKGVVKCCEICGAEFRVSQGRAETARFCSRPCAGIALGAKLQNRVTLVCEFCRTPFDVPRSHEKRRRFCSRECRDVDPVYYSERSARVLGEANAHWKGGVVPTSDGYLYHRAFGHPFASNGYVLQHRLVKEKELLATDPDSPFLIEIGGPKYLSPDFVVHHRDEDKTNNVPSNLECMTDAEHTRLHKLQISGRDRALTNAERQRRYKAKKAAG